MLEAVGLGFDYPGPLRAVDGVDLAVHPERVCVVCGPNGSGKSTLLNLMAGLLTPLRGEVRLVGRPLSAHTRRERARLLARVPQSLRTLPDVSVANFVLAGRYARIDRWQGPTRKDRDAVELALAACDAVGLGQRPMAALSGGQRQRVLLARALAQEAQVFLVDEPTAALDPEHQVKVFELIAGLARHGRGVVAVTHDLNLASQFATDVVLLQEGRVVTRGAPDEVLRAEVLTPVYGDHLHFGRMPPPDGRAYVLPWKAAGEGDGEATGEAAGEGQR